MSSTEAVGAPSETATSWGSRALQWIEDVGDRLNPILVKETRQALKSRQFVSAFLLLLLASWIASIFGVLWAGSSLEYGQAGRSFFAIFYFVLSVAALVVVPFGAFRSLLNERDESTYELLSITALSPKQIVWGKLLSALVQVFLYYSAIAPFVAFASLLQGFDFAQVSYLMVLLLVASLGYSMSALVLSTLARQKHTQMLMTLAMLGLAGWGFFTFVFAAIPGTMFVNFEDRDFWIGNAFALVAFISYFILFLQIATSQLTFDTDNRSTGIRLTMSGQFFLFWVCLLIGAWYYKSSPNSGDLQVFATMSALHWLVGGIFAVTENDTLSRRIMRKRPRNRLLRILMAPFLPGGSRGFFYILIHLLALWIIVSVVFPILAPPTATSFSGSRRVESPALFTGALASYVIIYLGLAAFLGRVGQSLAADMRPGHARMIAILTGLFASFIPPMFRLFKWVETWEFSIVDIFNPYVTLATISRDGSMDFTVFTLLGLAALAIVVNLRAMVDELTEVVSYDPANPAGVPTGSFSVSPPTIEKNAPEPA
ncbi:MAG: hypothetical protein AB7O26_11620 [Planctomycetaceae bacterium]